MCGIVGYTGKKEATEILIKGLFSLEYRGYDSAGVALLCKDGSVDITKCGGRVSELESLVKKKSVEANVGIAHTRWATHGAPTGENAHPHTSDSLVLVHNGIIDNYAEIKAELIGEGYSFKSDTDTEVIAHLIDREYKREKEPRIAITKATSLLSGSFALAIMFYDIPGEIFAIRRDNPLIIAFSKDGTYIASDIPAILKNTREIYRPSENIVIRVTENGAFAFTMDGKRAEIKTEYIDWSAGGADKEGYEYFMEKEINEEPDAIKRTVAHRVNGDGLPDFSGDGIAEDFFTGFDSIAIISCGSATHAGLFGKYIIEGLSGIPVTVNTASEYRYEPPAKIGRTLALAISQSGETADTLAGVRLAKNIGLKTAAIINTYGSAIAREADNVMYTNAGPEIAVATTKGYTTQLAILALIGIKLGLAYGKISEDKAREYTVALREDVPRVVGEIIKNRDKIKVYAEKISAHKDLYFIGRGPDSFAGVECSLKLKEISYIHSESYAAGELKHGTLSLIENGTPVIALATHPKFYDKMNGNIREVRTRGGYILLVCRADFKNPEEYSDDHFIIPTVLPELSPFATVVFSQILAYETAVFLGLDVDHPRNLAKSVTVE